MEEYLKENNFIDLQSFNKLNYASKLDYFKKHSALIRFPFPPLDLQLSWYDDETVSASFAASFYNEYRNKSIYELRQTIKEKEIIFDIAPTTPLQRLNYNNYILGLFLQTKLSAFENLNQNIEISDDPINYLEKQLLQMRSKIDWVKYTLEALPDIVAKPKLKNQFLKVFLKGYDLYHNYEQTDVDKTLGIKRKQIELFFLSQGMLFAEYLIKLQELLSEKKSRQPFVKPMSLHAKLTLMDRLGMLSYLKSKLTHHHSSEKIVNMTLAELINTIITDDIGAYTSVLNAVLALEYNINKKEMTDQENDSIEYYLQKWNVNLPENDNNPKA